MERDRQPHPAEVPTPGLLPRRPRYAVALWILIGLLLLSGAAGAVFRGLNRLPNWGSLSDASRYVWEHHQTQPDTKMFGYLPAATFLLWPFTTWLPQPAGLCLYVATNVLAAVLTLWIVRRWWLDEPERGWQYVFPCLLIAANFQHALQANQLTLWSLVLIVAGLPLVYRGRGLTGGLALGLAGLIKSMPFLLAGLLLLHRRWRALAGMAIAVLAADILPSLAFFGGGGAIAEHRAWLERAGWHSSRMQITRPLLIGPYRHASNFSYAGVLARWLRALPDASRIKVVLGDAPPGVLADARATLRADEVLLEAPMRPNEEPWRIDSVSLAAVPRFHLADLPAGAVLAIWAATLGGGMVLLAVATWRSARDAPSTWTCTAACWLTAMFFLSPMTRHYYLALAFPALVVVWNALRQERIRQGGGWTAGARFARLTLWAWLLGVLSLGWDVARWYGLHLAVLALLLAATAWAWRVRRPC